MTFDQLEYFMSCASCLNFSLAAKYHYVSVSTLSRNISALEEELGVKLFERGYHGHSLTQEGIRFFDFAESTCSELLEFWLDMEKRDIKRSKSDDVLRIGCYPFDNIFGKVVEYFNQLPADYFGRKYKVIFISPGKMVEAVESGRVHLGVANAAELDGCGERFFTTKFYHSQYCLRVGRDDPLFEFDEISISELIESRNKFTDYLPDIVWVDGMKVNNVCSEEDLAQIGHITLKHLPELIRKHGDKLNDKCLLMPSVLDLPTLKRKAVFINDCKSTIDFMFFGRRDNTEACEKIRILSEYASYI